MSLSAPVSRRGGVPRRPPYHELAAPGARLLAIPQLFVAWALKPVSPVLTLISLFTGLVHRADTTTDLQRHRHDLPLRVAGDELRLISSTRTIRPSTSSPRSPDDNGAGVPHEAPACPPRASRPGGSRSTSGSWPFPSTSCWGASASLRAWRSSAAWSPCSLPGSTLGEHPRLLGKCLPLRAPSGGVRRLPYRSLPALPPRGVNPDAGGRSWARLTNGGSVIGLSQSGHPAASTKAIPVTQQVYRTTTPWRYPPTNSW